MRIRIVWLMTFLLIVLVGLNSSRAQENILVNGGFEDGALDPWTTYGNATFEVVTKDPIEGNYCLYINVPAAGTNFWDVFLKYPDLVFEKGKH